MTNPPALTRLLEQSCPQGQRPLSVPLTMTGRIKLRAWPPFRATQWIDARCGFVWSARVGRAPLVIQGSHRYTDGAGAMDWKLWGAARWVADSSVDVTRSAAWRFAAEALAWLPGGSETVSGPRWGNPLRRLFGYYPFGVDTHAETTADGITAPSAFTASWFRGTPDQNTGEFFRAKITDVRFADTGALGTGHQIGLGEVQSVDLIHLDSARTPHRATPSPASPSPARHRSGAQPPR